MRAALPAGSGLVSIVRFNRTIFDQAPTAGASSRSLAKPSSRTIPWYVAFVLRPGTESPAVVPLGRADTLDALIAQWRRQLIASIVQSSETVSETQPSLGSRGASLRRRLWDPIALHLNGARRVFVVPDGAVNLVPLAALPVASGRYLLEDGPVLHYSFLRSATWCRRMSHSWKLVVGCWRLADPPLQSIRIRLLVRQQTAQSQRCACRNDGGGTVGPICHQRCFRFVSRRWFELPQLPVNPIPGPSGLSS